MFSILRRFQVQAGPLGSGSCMRTRTSPLTLVHVCCVQALSFDNESASHPAAPAAARPARARLRRKCARRTPGRMVPGTGHRGSVWLQKACVVLVASCISSHVTMYFAPCVLSLPPVFHAGAGLALQHQAAQWREGAGGSRCKCRWVGWLRDEQVRL